MANTKPAALTDLRAKLAALEARSVLRQRAEHTARAVSVELPAGAPVLDADRALSQASLAGDAPVAPEMPVGGEPALTDDPAGAGVLAPAPAPVLRILPPPGSVAPPPAVVQPRMPASRSNPAGGGGTGAVAVAGRARPIPYTVVVLNPFPGFTGPCLAGPANDEGAVRAQRQPMARASPATYGRPRLRAYG